MQLMSKETAEAILDLIFDPPVPGETEAAAYYRRAHNCLKAALIVWALGAGIVLGGAVRGWL